MVEVLDVSRLRMIGMTVDVGGGINMDEGIGIMLTISSIMNVPVRVYVVDESETVV